MVKITDSRLRYCCLAKAWRRGAGRQPFGRGTTIATFSRQPAMRAPAELLDEGSELSCDRARGRRGHPHALRLAQGLACHRRPLVARPCAACGRGSRRSPTPRSWSGPGRRPSPPRRERVLPGAQMFVQRERRGTAHAVLAAKAGDRARAPTTFSSSTAIRRSFAPATLSAARAVGRRRGLAVLGFRAGRPVRLRTARRRWRQARRHPRGSRRERRRNARSICATAA